MSVKICWPPRNERDFGRWAGLISNQWILQRTRDFGSAEQGEQQMFWGEY